MEKEVAPYATGFPCHVTLHCALIVAIIQKNSGSLSADTTNPTLKYLSSYQKNEYSVPENWLILPLGIIG